VDSGAEREAIASPSLVAFVAYAIWVSSTVVCSYLDPRFVTAPALAFVLSGAGAEIGVAGLRRRFLRRQSNLLVIGVLECKAISVEVLQIGG
jgi:hypothetical protein